MNTWKQKCQEDMITYRNTETKDFSPPFSLHRYAQMDFVLATEQWKNAVHNIHTITGMPFESDHKIVLCATEIKLAAQQKKQNTKVERYWKPDEEQKLEYNAN